MTLIMYILRSISGADPGFQVRGGADLKKLWREARTFLGVFRVKNHDFMQKNIFFPILWGERAGYDPPWILPLDIYSETY